MIRTGAIVVGASAAGLATSACLTRGKREHVLLEAGDAVAGAWRAHYERLHLHTHKGGSALPFVPFAPEIPRYPSRLEVVDYMERYVERAGLSPRFGEAAGAIRRDGDEWIVETSRERYHAPHVVLATGLTRVPHLPTWPEQDAYRGEVLHSSRYKRGATYAGRRVLVIGFGNSAGEIALDLVEQGASATLSVRSGVNVIPREILGIPIIGVGALLNVLPARIADLVGAPLVRLAVGDITRLGLKKLPYGPNTQVREHGTVPFIDIGTIAALRAGKIALRPGIERFTVDGVRFDDGTEEKFDAVIACTGYRPQLGDFLQGNPDQPDQTDQPGLHLCGFRVSPRGMLKQIGLDARAIARAIVNR